MAWDYGLEIGPKIWLMDAGGMLRGKAKGGVDMR